MNCELCKKEHDGSYSSGRFCSSKCARSFSTSKARKALNERISAKLSKRSREASDDDFKRVVSESSSWTNLAERMIAEGFAGTRSFFKEKILELKLNTSHFYHDLQTEEVLCKRPGRKGLLKKHLLLSGRKYECDECGLGPEWNSKTLTIQVDHINGDSTDHRLENLRFLCPNCHSQTDTFSWKNARRNSTSH